MKCQSTLFRHRKSSWRRSRIASMVRRRASEARTSEDEGEEACELYGRKDHWDLLERVTGIGDCAHAELLFALGSPLAKLESGRLNPQ